MRNIDWQTNLINAAEEAARNRGSDAVVQYLAERGIESLEDVNPSDYDWLFDDLDYMANDP